jgi:plastocyanin
MHRRAFLASGVGVAAALSGCAAQGGDSGDYDVGMSTDAFKPATLTVEVGETVVWKNTSKQGHTVTAYEDDIPEEAAYFASGGYDSQSAAREAWVGETGGRLAEGDTYEHAFEVPGDHRYFCIPHERIGMAGVVTVKQS